MIPPWSKSGRTAWWGDWRRFAEAMWEKARKRLSERPDYSPTPWSDYPPEFLEARLLEEVDEFIRSRPRDKDELLDVANLCLFLYRALEEVGEVGQ